MRNCQHQLLASGKQILSPTACFLQFTAITVVASNVPSDNDKKNDVVLTPRYVTSLMAKLARTDMDSFVWDTAMGSGGFLIAAMEQMIDDVKRKIPTQDAREKKIRHIKENQLLGIEV